MSDSSRRVKKGSEEVLVSDDPRIEEIPKNIRPMSIFLTAGLTEFMDTDEAETETSSDDIIEVPAETDPVADAKQNAVSRRRRPLTYVVPRNEAQAKQDREERQSRRSLSILNVLDDQRLDVQGDEAFVETLRRHLEGKEDSSGLVVLDEPKEDPSK